MFGDSHTMFWSGHEDIFTEGRLFRGLDLLHAGPVTAHNIDDPAASTGGRALFAAHMAEHGHRYGAVLLCMGEIDCRVHVIREAVLRDRDPRALVEETVGRYLGFVRFVRETHGLPVVLFGPGPSTTISIQDARYPSHGSMVERNAAVVHFNDVLDRECAGLDGVAHFSLLEHLIDERGATRPDALHDGVHVAARWLPFAAAGLKRILGGLGRFDLFPALGMRRVRPTAVVRDVARDGTYVLSSSFDGEIRGDMPREEVGDFFFHTLEEPTSHIVVDLGGTYFIEKIEVRNARGRHACDVRSLRIECSTDHDSFRRIYGGMGLAFTDTEPLAIDAPPRKFATRYVRIGLAEPGVLSLSGITVLAPSFDDGES